MWFLITGILLILPMMMSFFGRNLVRTKVYGRNGRVYYRTERSMKNQATKTYAHKVCGRFYVWVGRRAIIVSIVMALIFIFIPVRYYETLCGIWLMTEMVMLLSAVPVTENALKKKFYQTSGY